MRIITLVAQKGGSGKSTLTFCLAAAAEGEGLRVAIIDTDPQCTVFKWGHRRLEEGRQTPIVKKCYPHLIRDELKSLLGRGIDLCLIDTPGTDSVSVVMAITHSHYCLIPVRPTIADTQAVIETARQLRDRKHPFAFVLSQCSGSMARINDAAAGLLRHGEIAAANIHHRVDYPDADNAGLGVTEYNPNGAAAKELRLLWAWLHRAIGGHA